MCARAAVLLGPEVWVHGGAARAQDMAASGLVPGWCNSGSSGEGAQHLPLQCIHGSNICCLLWRQEAASVLCGAALGSAPMPLQFLYS